MSGLLLIHGFTSDPSSWDEVVTRLSVAALIEPPQPPRPPQPVVREPLLGHEPAGAEVISHAASFTGEVDRIADSLRARGLSELHLCGYSLGGRIAFGLLARHPDLFRRATIISAHPGLPTDEERSTRAAADERWAALLDRKGIESFVTAWEAQPLFSTQARLPDRVRAAERARRLARSPAGLAHALRVLGLARMPDLSAALGRVSIPVALIAGEDDPKFCAIAKDLAPRFVQCSIRIIPGAGHNVILERPDAIATALLEAPHAQ